MLPGLLLSRSTDKETCPWRKLAARLPGSCLPPTCSIVMLGRLLLCWLLLQPLSSLTSLPGLSPPTQAGSFLPILGWELAEEALAGRVAI